MPLETVILPCLQDNYAYLLHDAHSGRTACVDVPDAAALLTELERRGWQLNDILITHHHWDHIDGVEALRAATGAKVTGAAADAHRLPKLDRQVNPGDLIEVCGEAVEVIDVPGHTLGHVAYYFAQTSAVFTADSLMVLGCGRLFEGTPAQMWQSLQRLSGLPPHTEVYSGHEYSNGNARFALTIEPGNPILQARVAELAQARADGRPVVPARLSLELQTNPYLRAHLPEVKAAIGMPGASDIDAFAEIRARKDRF